MLTCSVFDFRFYSSALTGANISSIFSDGNGCDEISSNLETRYELREETGNAVSVTDTSGNGRTGAVANSPAYEVESFVACVTDTVRMIDGGLMSSSLMKSVLIN